MRLAFIVYVSRSGSTLLARLLSERTNDCIVVPELRLPELLLLESEQRVCAYGPARLRGLMARDPQLAALEFQSATLDSLAADAAGLGPLGVLRKVAIAYAAGRVVDPRLAVYKQGSLLLHAPQLLGLEPGLRFIHIHRDPRAVTASALANERPYFAGEGFGRRDPVFIARVWQRHTQLARVLSAQSLCTVSYADLLNHSDRTLARLAAWLDVPLRAAGDGGFAVAGAEQAAHKMVGYAPDPTRLEAWQQTLPAWAGYAVERIAAGTMQQTGYTEWYGSRLGRVARTQARLTASAVHGWRTVVFLLRRAHDLLRHPADTMSRLRARRRRGPMA